MSPHAKALCAAIVVALMMTIVVLSHRKEKNMILQFLDIGVEHTETATIGINVTKNDALRMVAIGNTSDQLMHVSVPEQWKRSEARGVALKDLHPEPPAFGYVRFALPAGASVTFTSNIPFNHLRIQNPSGQLLKIAYTTVDLMTNDAVHDVFLVKEGNVELP